jgi:hypothetical protein
MRSCRDADGRAGQRPEPLQLEPCVGNVLCRALPRWGDGESHCPRVAHQLHQDVHIDPQRLQSGCDQAPTSSASGSATPGWCRATALQPALQPIEAGVATGSANWRKRRGDGGILTGHAGGDEEDTKESAKRRMTSGPRARPGRVMLHRCVLAVAARFRFKPSVGRSPERLALRLSPGSRSISPENSTVGARNSSRSKRRPSR